VVVTSSVRIAGVLLVFSYLIVPALAGILLGRTVTHKLLIGWGFGTLVSVIGITASAVFDLPTGATVVCAFGATLIVLWAAFQAARPASGRLTPSAWLADPLAVSSSLPRSRPSAAARVPSA